MKIQPIQFFNRYAKAVEVEDVYGLDWVAWTYHHPLGHLMLHALAKRALFSQWYGWRMNREASRAKIEPFIQRYGIDRAEMADPVESMRNFNDFFARRLKPAARPIAPGDRMAVFPADGRHLGFQVADEAKGFFVKGQRLDIDQLLQNQQLADRYRKGALVLSRLCPVDYHRFHFPVAGVPGPSRLLPGPLFSVNPIALRRNINYLATNKRMLCEIENERFGKVLMMEIGATCVGTIRQTYQPSQNMAKGSEKGYFLFGGSSTLTLFEPGAIKLAEDLTRESAQQRELYAKVGDAMGTASR